MDTESKGSIALKAGTWYVISTVLVKVVSVITTPIFTRLLTTEEYGLVSTFTTWYSLLLPIFTLNLTYSIGRAKLDFPGKLDEYIGSMQLLSAIVSIVIIAVSCVFLKPISRLLSLSEAIVLLLMAYLFFMPAISFAQNGYRYQYQYKQNIAISWYTIVTNVGCSLLLILFINADKTLLRCVGIVAPIVLLSLFFWVRSLRRRTVRINRTYWKYGLTISLPLVVHTLSLHILSSSDRIFITNICGASDTGIYSLAYQIGIILSTITNAVSEGWLPWFHDTYQDGDFQAIRKNSRQLVLLGCYIGLACIALSPELIALLGGKAYAAGVYCVPPIVLGIVCQYIYTHYVNIELHMKKTRYVSMGTIIAAALNLGLNAIFIPMYGYVAAAYTTLVSYLVLFIIHFLITSFILKVKLYNDLFMFAAMVITGVVGVVLTLTYDYSIIRYLLIAAGFVSFLVVFREFVFKYIKKYLKRIKGGNTN